VEIEVLERVVLGVDARWFFFGSTGSAFGTANGDQDAVALEAQVPVQAGGVVLLDDEARRGRPAAGRFWPWAPAVASKSRLASYSASGFFAAAIGSLECPQRARRKPADQPARRGTRRR
jgi:hypothetical protein